MAQNPFQSPQTLPHDSPARFRFLVLRTLGWYVLTTGTVFAMLMAMPPGFAGVPYSGGVLGMFLATFLIVATRERSLSMNAVVVTSFWVTLTLFDFVTASNAELVSLEIAIIAAFHMAMQLAVCFIYPIVSRKLHEEREEMRGKD